MRKKTNSHAESAKISGRQPVGLERSKFGATALEKTKYEHIQLK